MFQAGSRASPSPNLGGRRLGVSPKPSLKDRGNKEIYDLISSAIKTK